MARPLTHDLMYYILNEVDVAVERIIITDLKDSTYFAELILSRGDKAMIIDCRPSDAIAIAIRASAPIFVAEKVLDQAKVAIENNQMPPIVESGSETVEQKAEEEENSQTDFKNIDKEKWNDLLKELDPDDFKYKM
jgi:bifunctional DNase/RNase